MAPKQKNEEALTPEEVVGLALNEQGYLFHHKIIQVLQPPGGTHSTVPRMAGKIFPMCAAMVTPKNVAMPNSEM